MRSFDQAPAPDYWSEVELRASASAGAARRERASGLAVLIVAALLAVLAISAALVVVSGLLKLPAVLPLPSPSGSPTSPVASPSADASPVPSPTPDPNAPLGRFTDPLHDPATGDLPLNPDIAATAIRLRDGNLVFSVLFAEAFPVGDASISIVIADPDTVPPDGPPSGSRAPYCSAYEGPFVIWYEPPRTGSGARLSYHDWDKQTAEVVDSLQANATGRTVEITVPAAWVAEIRALDPDHPRLSFSMYATPRPGSVTYDYFPQDGYTLGCQTVDL